MKGKRIILSETVNEIRIALVERGELKEFFVERADIDRMVGNIYKGRVTSVHKGLQAAFVDIGVDKAAFLPLSKVQEGLDFDTDEDTVTIQEHFGVEPGDEVLVQVIKDPLGTKGARVTMNISIPGKFLVLTPMNNRIAISRKISDRREKERLRRIVRMYKPKDMGFIIRTAAEGRTSLDFQMDIKNLLKLWTKIRRKAARTSKKNIPALIHKDAELIVRLIRDLFTEDIDDFIVDSKDAHRKVVEYVSAVTPAMVKKVKLYKSRTPIFKTFKVRDEINKMLNRKVTLKSGGYIIIEPTEALTTIDVNSGKSSSDTVPEELALTTNLEAAEVIAKQLRLRDIGGIIVIDFIDMKKQESKNRVLTTFKKFMKNDRARYKILEISDLGLMEMTRKRVSPGVSQTFFEICPVCGGKGKVLSRTYLALKLIRCFESNIKKLENKTITVYANPVFIDYFSEEFSELLQHFAKRFRLSIHLVKDATLRIDALKIFDNESLKGITNAILV